MSEFRKEPGERIRDVYKLGRRFLITKAGKAVAMLVPVPLAENQETEVKAPFRMSGDDGVGLGTEGTMEWARNVMARADAVDRADALARRKLSRARRS
jgi:antitoxin (DNA-binding transcriptional repressor) of toxin-antitoxin stability system